MRRPLKIFLADLVHTFLAKDEVLCVPLNIGYIKAYVAAHLGSSVDISLFKHTEKFLSRVVDEKPDIIGFSNYTWNQNLNRTVGNYIRKMLPDSLIVTGGPNFDPDPARGEAFLRLHDYLDFVVVGNGEESFAELLEWWRDARGDHENLPPNVAWLDGDGFHQTGERPLTKVIDNIESPYLGGGLDEFLDAGMIPIIETNRGCPFKCTFCTWGAATKNLVRRFDTDMVMAEVDYLSEHSASRIWMSCDANFGMLERDVDIARAVRKVKEEKGYPNHFGTWMAKNATERNIEIGKILGDMTHPIMAIQSTNDEVLTNIRRDNISSESYVKYAQLFHNFGQRVWSNLIVPLPGETCEMHVDGLRSLCEFGVDNIANHNLVLLAGAEINSTKTREDFGFRTRYRLYPGNIGRYKCPDGTVLRVFEHEESPRETTTMNEEDLFFIRKLHFIVDCAWNSEVFKPLLELAQAFGVNAIDILCDVLEVVDKGAKSPDEQTRRVSEFFERLDRVSRDEWFDTFEELEAHYSDDAVFDALIEENPEKLYMMFSLILLEEYKKDFDVVIKRVIEKRGVVPPEILDDAANYAGAKFPPLDYTEKEREITVSAEVLRLTNNKKVGATISSAQGNVRVKLVASPKRQEFRDILSGTRNQTLSKILVSKDIKMMDLQLVSVMGSDIIDDIAAKEWAAASPYARDHVDAAS